MTRDAPSVRTVALCKGYPVFVSPKERLAQQLFNLRPRELRYAVKDVSFELPVGGRLGILGENGSGKSTLLRMLAGVLRPTSGQMYRRGRIAALLELGSAFVNDLTGRQNIIQSGQLMGLSRDEALARVDEIVEFSELADVIDEPVKVYSSGMSMRLAFACAAHVSPHILIVDEALSVGDAYFQKKCLEKIKRMLDGGLTFIYVSHSVDSIKSLCDTALLLHHGSAIGFGESKEVTKQYDSMLWQKHVAYARARAAALASNGEAEPSAPARRLGSDNGSSGLSVSQAFANRVAALRQGTGEARFTDVELLVGGAPCNGVVDFGQAVTVRLHVQVHVQLQAGLSVGLGVQDARGIQVLQFMSHDLGEELPTDKSFSVDFSFTNVLRQGSYSLSFGLSTMEENPELPRYTQAAHVYDSCFGALVFECLPAPDVPVWGLVRVPAQCHVQTADSSLEC